MQSELLKIYKLKNFFKILKSNENYVQYSLLKPSRLLLQNIYKNWMQFILLKTHKDMPIYNDKSHCNNIKIKIPFGYIQHDASQFQNDNLVQEDFFDEKITKNKIPLQIHIIVPQQDMMQYFMQWQRYRKFWWSSITTTPSLITVSDIEYENHIASASLYAQFRWGTHAIESIKIDSTKSTAHLSCSLDLENALKILMLDSINNSKDYLRIHRKMAPYKLSFAIDCEDSNSKPTLIELATLLHYKLLSKKISNYLPNFICSKENQFIENLQMGVAYTVLLSEETLNNGVFNLLNSKTGLKEQVHLADFEPYASLICNR